MSLRLILATLCLLAGFDLSSLVAQKIGEVPKEAPTTKAARETTLEWTSSAKQPYWYRLPKKISAKRPPNLIFMLHGTGGNHGWAFWNYGIGRGEFRKNDIVVSPEGVTPGGGKTFNFVQNQKDGDQLADLIKTFRAAFPINNVYVYGHSQGAFFCYWFAGEYPELVDGIVAHAGNVLQVKHPKLAKKKVAVVILHADSDQVVSVKCAHRTHKIYEKEGYKLLRLEIVEGIRPAAGHWPLPKQVSEMLAWCDKVCASTPGSALDVAIAEIGKKDPDLATLQESLEKAEDLMKAHKGKDRAELQERLAKLEAFLESCVLAHVETIEKSETLNFKRGKNNVPAAHFQLAHQVFKKNPTWKKRFGRHFSRAKNDAKKIAKVQKKMNKDHRKAYVEGVKVYWQCVLGEGHRELGVALTKAMEMLPKGRTAEELQHDRALIPLSLKSYEEDAVTFKKVTADLAEAFREKEKALFE